MESTRIEGYVDERNLKSHTEAPDVTGVYLWPGPGNPEYPVRRGLLLISSDGSMPRVFTEGEVKALVDEAVKDNVAAVLQRFRDKLSGNVIANTLVERLRSAGYTMSMKTITKNERLQLIGLLTIARQHNDKANDFRQSMYELLGYDPDAFEGDSGHIDDAVFDGNNRSVDDLLKRMKITVKR